MHSRSTTVAFLAITALLLLCAFCFHEADAIDVNMKGYLAVTKEELAKTGFKPTFDNSKNACMDRGGTLASDWSLIMIRRTSGTMQDTNGYTGEVLTIYGAETGKPPPNNPLLCKEFAPEKPMDPEYCGTHYCSVTCFYMLTFGFWNMYSYLRKLPGCPTWQGLYNLHYPSVQVVNNVIDPQWNSTLGKYYYPRGRFGYINGVYAIDKPRPLYMMYRMDALLITNEEDSANPLSSYMLACEFQEGFTFNAQPPKRMYQPEFVKGWKGDTWAQKHWWVIFLIVAVVLLIVLFLILIFCCSTRNPLKAGPPIVPMVLRERDGNPYVRDDEDMSNDEKSGNTSRDVDPIGAVPNRALQQSVQPPAMPLMPPRPLLPEEVDYAVQPVVYTQDDTLLASDGDSFAGNGDSASSMST